MRGRPIVIDIKYPRASTGVWKYLGARILPDLYDQVNAIRESKKLSWSEFLTPWFEKIVEVEKGKK